MKKVFSKIIFCLIVLSLIIPITKTQAVYQSRPEFQALTNNGSTWFKTIREMEKSGGVLGLSATLNTSTYEENSTSGNGIDVHMIKNSEWGAIVMLSLSAYGGYDGVNVSSISNYSTGANNYTGVYGLGNNWEYTATTFQYENMTNSTTSYTGAKAVTGSVASKYYDTYYMASTDYDTSSDVTKAAFWNRNYTTNVSLTKIVHHGDALYELSNFVASKNSNITQSIISSGAPWFVRGNGSALAFNSALDVYGGIYCRAVVVCGAGL
jgi:hypothetical protein